MRSRAGRGGWTGLGVCSDTGEEVTRFSACFSRGLSCWFANGAIWGRTEDTEEELRGGGCAIQVPSVSNG